MNTQEERGRKEEEEGRGRGDAASTFFLRRPAMEGVRVRRRKEMREGAGHRESLESRDEPSPGSEQPTSTSPCIFHEASSPSHGGPVTDSRHMDDASTRHRGAAAAGRVRSKQAMPRSKQQSMQQARRARVT